MSFSGIFKFDISLERLARIALAVGFWEKPDVKEKMLTYNFEDDKEFCYEPSCSKEISKGQHIIHYIFEQLDLLILPAKLLEGIKTLVVRIGRKIYSWKKYVCKTLKLDLRYAEKIYWNSYGDINELQVLEKFWLRQKQLDGECCFMNNKLFCIAANYGNESFVQKNIEKFKQEIFPYVSPAQQKQDWTPDAVIAAWIWLCASKDRNSALLFQLDNNIFRVLPEQLPASGIVKKCSFKNLEFAVKYFWRRLNVNERELLGVSIARHLHDNLKYDIYDDFNWDIEKQLRMLLFLINEMAESEKKKFINEKFNVLFNFCLRVWPYQDLCVKIVYQIVDQAPDKLNYELLNFITSQISCDNSGHSVYFTGNQTCSKVLQILMERVSKTVKQDFFIGYEHYIKYFSNNKFCNVKALFKTLDLESATLVINDPDLQESRKELLDIWIIYFKKAVLKADYKSINKFIEDMNFGEDDLKLFKRKLNVLNVLMSRGEMELAEKHLNWLADSDEEKNDLKNQVDAVNVSLNLLRNNKFNIAEEFLKWRFKEVDEIDNVKEILKSDDFLKNKIFEIWGSKNFLNKTTFLSEKCALLLGFFFKEEEKIVKFKKELTEDKVTLIEKYWDHLFYTKTFRHLNDFLEFCLFTWDDIKQMKTDIEKKINWWIDTFALEKCKLKMVDKLLDWTFLFREEMIAEVKKNYMGSVQGSLLCVKVFKNYKKSNPEIIRKFYNSWIDESLDIAELKRTLDECDLVVEPNIIKCIKLLLDKRVEGRDVRNEHLSKYLTFYCICERKHDHDDEPDDYCEVWSATGSEIENDFYGEISDLEYDWYDNI